MEGQATRFGFHGRNSCWIVLMGQHMMRIHTNQLRIWCAWEFPYTWFLIRICQHSQWFFLKPSIWKTWDLKKLNVGAIKTSRSSYQCFESLSVKNWSMNLFVLRHWRAGLRLSPLVFLMTFSFWTPIYGRRKKNHPVLITLGTASPVEFDPWKWLRILFRFAFWETD